MFILSAVSLNSTELMSFTGTMLGIAVSIVFGVLFVRGSVKINLQRFFRVTTRSSSTSSRFSCMVSRAA